MSFFEAPGVPKVTAKRGTDEFYAQVVAYQNWLDECYLEAELAARSAMKEIEDTPVFGIQLPGDPEPCPDCRELYMDGMFCEKHTHA